MKLLITGDLVLNQPYQTSYIDQNLIDLFKQSDLSIVNLEAPVTKNNSKIDKTGPNIKSHKESTKNVLDILDIDIVTLANNHVLDYDEQGVYDTLDFCKANNIKTVGAGMNLEEASEILYVETQEGKIAIVNFAENEWTSATKESAGSNPMDLIDNLKQIKDARSEADFVFIIVHGGNEHNHYPSPRMVKQYRFYAENGADAVIGHHTHCVSGYEKHNDVPIFYSLGNFLFPTEKKKRVGWYSGLVVEFNLTKYKGVNFELIPIVLDENTNMLKIANNNQAKDIFGIVEEVNSVIANENLLESKWLEFIDTIKSGYIKSITPLGGINNRYLRTIFYRLGLHKLLLNKFYLKEHLNRIRCEAHYDVTKSVLNNLINEQK